MVVRPSCMDRDLTRIEAEDVNHFIKYNLRYRWKAAMLHGDQSAPILEPIEVVMASLVPCNGATLIDKSDVGYGMKDLDSLVKVHYDDSPIDLSEMT